MLAQKRIVSALTLASRPGRLGLLDRLRAGRRAGVVPCRVRPPAESAQPQEPALGGYPLEEHPPRGEGAGRQGEETDLHGRQHRQLSRLRLRQRCAGP